ncbi:MAG TPA: replication factor C large subunit [archaeon]|nr:replication factor C large subunit [archaeon]
MAQMWTEKYFPSSFDEFIGNSEIAQKAEEWAKKWNAGEKQPPLLLWGQTGSGKTCLAYLIAKQFKWDVVELNSSDLRSKDSIERIAGTASQNASMFASRRLVLLDEVDALTSRDRGGASAIASIVKNAQNPVILTATDIFSDKTISALRFICKAFEFKKINYLSIAKRLEQILKIEKITYDPESIKELARNSSGDMRSALLDLETLAFAGNVSMEDAKSLSYRERQQKVFGIMKAIFKGMDFAQIRSMRSQSDLSNDMLFQWVEENIPRQYSNADDVALAFDRLSRADVFNGRIYNRQHWGFLKYSTELAAEGVALSKQKPSNDFVMYQFPGLLSMLSKTSGLRNMKKQLGLKIGKLTNSSSRKVISADLPYLKMIFENRESAVALTASFGLEEKELAFLLDTTPETKKVQSILAEVSEILGQNARPKPAPFAEASEVNEDLEEVKKEVPDSDDEPAGPRTGNQTKLF